MASETPTEPDQNDGPGIRSDLLVLIPKVLWFLLAAVVVVLVARPVLRALDQGQGVEVSAASVSLKIAERRLEKARTAVGSADSASEWGLEDLTDRIRRSQRQLSGATVLWVDDNHPLQNAYERRALNALGVAVDAVQTTEQGLAMLRSGLRYDAIVTDGRRENGDPEAPCFFGSQLSSAGCAFIQQVRALCETSSPPAIIYASTYDPGFGTPAFAIGGTNQVRELVMLLLDAFERRPEAATDDEFMQQDDLSSDASAKMSCRRTSLPAQTVENAAG